MQPTVRKNTEMLTQPEPDWLKTVRSQVQALRYGVVQILIHDSKVVQIERTEKIRFQHASKSFE